MRFLLLLLMMLVPTELCGQAKKNPPKLAPPTEAEREEIQRLQAELKRAIQALRSTQVPDLFIAEAELFLKGSEWILTYNEFYAKDSVKWTINGLKEGLNRAKRDFKSPEWLSPLPKSKVYAYRSKLDNSVQPFAVCYPTDYSTGSKKFRLDVVLHGRDGTLSEPKFFNSHNGTKSTNLAPDSIVLEVFGRGNNAYRWAGEADVFEAIEAFRQRETLAGRADRLDPNRVVLRGFSMGGAGTWHLGLHHPDRFCVIGPGAGFTTTHGYLKSIPNPLPSPQEECLTIYDAIRYAENVRELPVVAYSGAKDPQKAAADQIEKRLTELKIPGMTHLIAPGLEHQFPAEWQRKAEAEWVKYAGAGKGRNPDQDEIHFTTYTLKYAKCDWVEILGMEKHYQQSQIHAIRTESEIKVSTKNITAFRLLALKPGTTQVSVDDQKLELGSKAKAKEIVCIRSGKNWSIGQASQLQGRKRPGLTGPIDDAFTTKFVLVKSDRKSIHPKLQASLDAQLERFRSEWHQYFRGELNVISANETDKIPVDANLILWGDPSSNSLIEKLLPKLPIKWTTKTVEIGGKRYEASTHLPVLIYPHPERPNQYLVLNSGHTFHEADFKGTNALLYARLGDFAIIKPTPTANDATKFEVIQSGLFDESWQFPK